MTKVGLYGWWYAKRNHYSLPPRKAHFFLMSFKPICGSRVPSTPWWGEAGPNLEACSRCKKKVEEALND